ncbi:MAG TPA: NlpC/P60 family protein [Saprospiraceae bacterium]|nr:NlpC/P60 family protein [Saprospiraceae bacterium]
MFAICPVSTAAIRATPAHASEMISQLIFGEMVQIEERKGKAWLKVRCLWDNTTGWMLATQLMPIVVNDYEFFRKNYAFALDLCQPVLSEKFSFPVPLGARLPGFDGLHFRLNGTQYHYSGQAVYPESLSPSVELLNKIARRYLNAPFLHGGRSPFGIDADGLVQMIFKIMGKVIPRYAHQQVLIGEPVDFVDQAEAGDIAFFENSKGTIAHAAVFLNPCQVIHVYGCVRIDALDHFGIFNETENKYTHRLRIIKRITPLVKNQKEMENQAEKADYLPPELFGDKEGLPEILRLLD